MYFRLFGLHPFSKTSKCGEFVNWHIVLFNMWFDTGIPWFWLDGKWETGIVFVDDYLAISAEWFKWKDKTADRYKNTLHFRLPTMRTCYKYEILSKDIKWVPASNIADKDIYYIDEEVNCFQDFKYYNVKATVDAERRKYNFWWLPKCLKWLFSTTIADMNIRLVINDEIVKKITIPMSKHGFMYSWFAFKQSALNQFLEN